VESISELEDTNTFPSISLRSSEAAIRQDGPYKNANPTTIARPVRKVLKDSDICLKVPQINAKCESGLHSIEQLSILAPIILENQACRSGQTPRSIPESI
jgi:hypothetical protein